MGRKPKSAESITNEREAVAQYLRSNGWPEDWVAAFFRDQANDLVFYNREGQQIKQWQWAIRQSKEEVRTIRKTEVRRLTVTTTLLGVAHKFDRRPQIFETTVMDTKTGIVLHIERESERQQAVWGHNELVFKLRNGESIDELDDSTLEAMDEAGVFDNLE
jgi:hypothetical protein